MTGRQGRRTTLTTYPLVLILLAGVILYLGWGFVRQVSINHQRNQELDRIEEEILAAQGELARAEDALKRSEAPQAAEEWARQNGWALPDEALVVMVSPSSDGPPAAEDGAPEDAGPVSPRKAWWDLLFGSR